MPRRWRRLGHVAKVWGLRLHVDGARFANAVAAGNASPADLTWRAGVDVLSFGATKNGAMAAEAVVVFSPDVEEQLGFRRKRGAHLFSKMRFLSAQLEAYVDGDLWLKNARHANDQAAALAAHLEAAGVDLLFPVEANEVFATAAKEVWDRLLAAGFVFYTWGDPDRPHARFVTSFNTDPADIGETRRHACLTQSGGRRGCRSAPERLHAAPHVRTTGATPPSSSGLGRRPLTPETGVRVP